MNAHPYNHLNATEYFLAFICLWWLINLFYKYRVRFVILAIDLGTIWQVFNLRWTLGYFEASVALIPSTVAEFFKHENLLIERCWWVFPISSSYFFQFLERKKRDLQRRKIKRIKKWHVRKSIQVFFLWCGNAQFLCD